MSIYINSDLSVINSSLYTSGDITFASGVSSVTDSTIKAGGNLVVNAAHSFSANGLAGSHWLIGGNATFTGSSGNPKDLQAIREWLLDVAGSGNATYCNVAYSNAGGGSTIMAADGTSHDLGHNINWNFANYAIILEQAILFYLESLPDFSDVDFYPVRANRNSQMPLIIFQRVSGGHDWNLGASDAIARPTFQFTIYAHSYKQVAQLGRKFRKAFHAYRGFWDTLKIFNCNVTDCVSLPTIQLGEKEHGKIYNQRFSVVIDHREILPVFEATVEIDESGTIEEAFRGYLGTLTDAPIYYDDLPQQLKPDSYPAITIERLSSGLDQHLVAAFKHAEPRFLLHLYGKSYREISELGHDLWKGLHTYRGTWGDMFISHCVVESIADLPVEEGSDLEHGGYFHKGVYVRIWHPEDLTI